MKGDDLLYFLPSQVVLVVEGVVPGGGGGVLLLLILLLSYVDCTNDPSGGGVSCKLAFRSRAIGRSREASLSLGPSNRLSVTAKCSLRFGLELRRTILACNCVFHFIIGSALDLSFVSGLGLNGVGFIVSSSRKVLDGVRFSRLGSGRLGR